MDSPTSLGSGTVSGGVATLSAGPFAVGNHSLTAVYSGDGANLTSTSTALSVSIHEAGPGTMTWKYGYEAMGRLTSVIDPNGLGNVTAQSSPDSGVSQFTYNQRLPGQVFDAETGLSQNWHREHHLC